MYQNASQSKNNSTVHFFLMVTHNDLQVHQIEQQTELRVFSTANMK